MTLPWTRRKKVLVGLEAYCEAIRQLGREARQETDVTEELDLRTGRLSLLKDISARRSFRAA